MFYNIKMIYIFILICFITVMLLAIIYYYYYKNEIIVTMTTSPRRILLCKDVIESVFNQTTPPDILRINIPEIFKRTGEKYKVPDFIRNNPKIKVHLYNKDFGPITKILPTFIDYKNSNNKIIIYIDDDILLLPKTIETYVKYVQQNPDDVYCLSGYRYTTNCSNYIRDFNNINIAEGYMSVCINSNIINKCFVDLLHYYSLVENNIDCFRSDDFIFSNFLAMNNINIIKIFERDINYNIFWNSNCVLSYGLQNDALQVINVGGHQATYNRVYEFLRAKGLNHIIKNPILFY